MQSEVKQQEAAITDLKKENNQYKKSMAETQDKMNALKGKLSYLVIEAKSLQSDIELLN